jgi:hypothetical protein
MAQLWRKRRHVKASKPQHRRSRDRRARCQVPCVQDQWNCRQTGGGRWDGIRAACRALLEELCKFGYMPVSRWQARILGRHPRRHNVPEIDRWQPQSNQRGVGSGSSEGRATADASLQAAGSTARRGVRSCAAPRSLARPGVPLIAAPRRRARLAKASKNGSARATDGLAPRKLGHLVCGSGHVDQGSGRRRAG